MTHRIQSVYELVDAMRRIAGHGNVRRDPCMRWLTIVILLCVPMTSHGRDYSIGVIAGITGHGASYGAGIVQGAQMAVEEINAAGGINGHKLSLRIEDDASEPARSAIAMRRLISATPDVIVGGWGSSQVLAHMDFPEQSAVPYIVVGATNPRITSKVSRWVFRVIQSDTVQSEQLAVIAAGKLGLQRIAIIADSNAYGSSSREIFIRSMSRYGQRPVAAQIYRTTDTDFSTQLLRIREMKPDALAIFGTLPAAPRIMTQAHEHGIQARILGGAGLVQDEVLHQAEGGIFMSYFNEDADAESMAWAQRYREKFSGQNNSPILAAWEYRAIRYIVAPCLQRADTDRSAMRDCIAKWRGKVFGIGTEVWFDEAGQLVQPALAVTVQNGRFQNYRLSP